MICIGNISAGGNGKTPLVAFTAEYFKSIGKRPVILTRGYGGSIKGPHQITGAELASECGDEPFMLFQSLSIPVVIARNRVAGAKLIEEKGLGEVILLDDGLQHRRLKRDIDIICQYVGTPKATESFLRGKLIPFGRLREQRGHALSRAHCIVYSHRKPHSLSQLDKRLLDIVPEEMLCIESFVELTQVANAQSGEALPQKSKVQSLSAIAQPDGFLETLKAAGYFITAKYIFGDHHSFSKKEISNIISHAHGTPIVCTQKDIMKIPEKYHQYIWVAETRLTLSHSDAYIQMLKGKCQR